MVTFMKLTEKFCMTASIGIYWDSQLPSFGLRVHKNTRSYVLFTRDITKKKKQIVIGHVGDLSLNDARERARYIKEGKEEKRLKKVTVRDICMLYLNDYATRYRKSYKDDISLAQRFILPVLGEKNVTSVTVQDCDSLHKSIAHKVQANRAIKMIRAMYAYASRMQVITCQCPASAVRLHSEYSRDRFLTVDEIARLIKGIEQLKKTHLLQATAIEILLFTACRRNEILSLKWEQINFLHRFFLLETTKNGKKRVVPLLPELIASLEKLPKVSEFVFPGKSEHIKELRKTWSRLCKIAELQDVHLHDMRRTAASHLVMHGKTLYEASKILGHSSTSCTSIYARFDVESVRTLLSDFKKIVNSRS